MKAGIITHYNVHNHGAQLQMYALARVLSNFGFEAQALTFNKNYDFFDEGLSKKYNISIKSFPLYLKYLIQNGLGRTIYNINKRKILNNFRIENKLIGDFYSKAEKLDLVVIGSDEIFSFESGINPWYWGIGVRCSNIISYAASFGPTDSNFILSHNVSHLVEGGAKNIKTILVRDENSKQLIKEFSGKESSIVCDPVILYPFMNENKISLSIVDFRKKLTKRYCIIYSYDSNMNDLETVESIKNYAKTNHLEIYSVGYYHKWCDRNIQVKPLDIFKWFSCAEMVFTDTFHGTVLSIVTGTQFLSKIRGNGYKLRFLLKQFGLMEREVSDFSKSSIEHCALINFEIVNKNITAVREKSLDLLKKAIGDPLDE